MSLMTFKEALAFLRISDRTLRTMVYSRQIPFHKVGVKYLFDRIEIESWLLKKRNEHTGVYSGI